jgi:hypothetical protein
MTVIAKLLCSLAIASGLSHVGAAADSLLSSSSSCAVAFARIVPLSAHSGMRAAGHYLVVSSIKARNQLCYGPYDTSAP